MDGQPSSVFCMNEQSKNSMKNFVQVQKQDYYYYYYYYLFHRQGSNMNHELWSVTKTC